MSTKKNPTTETTIAAAETLRRLEGQKSEALAAVHAVDAAIDETRSQLERRRDQLLAEAEAVNAEIHARQRAQEEAQRQVEEERAKALRAEARGQEALKAVEGHLARLAEACASALAACAQAETARQVRDTGAGHGNVAVHSHLRSQIAARVGHVLRQDGKLGGAVDQGHTQGCNLPLA